MDYYTDNLRLLKKRFPELVPHLDKVNPDTIGTAQAQDGGVCYAVQGKDGKWTAITNPVDPIQKAQEGINRMTHRLGQGFNPAVVVGLCPGYVLDTVFRHFHSRLAYNEPFRHLYVIVDSIPCLIGWMKTADRSAILEREEVLFFHHDELQKMISLIESDLQRSHLFIPISELPESEINRRIVPLAEFYLKREEELEQWKRENNKYYNAIPDEQLAEIISGKADRKPRLLMPTHSASTVIQYSTRDTCEAFDAAGWETRILKAERDMPPWLIAKNIYDFKPDIFLFINHLRTEAKDPDIYPDNLMFITWIQDAMPDINNREMAEKWTKMALTDE